MKSIANKSSFGAKAMSGASSYSAARRLLLTRPHVAAPGDRGKWHKRR